MIRFAKHVIGTLLSELDNCYKTAMTGGDSLLPDIHILEEELARSDTETQFLYKVMASGFRWSEIELTGPVTTNEPVGDSKEEDESQ